MRLLLMFLIAVQLLMPPGMCICRFAQSESPRAANNDPLPIERITRKSDKSCCASCKHRCEQVNFETVGNPKIFPIDGPSRSTPQQHEPGCPALQSAESVKFAESLRPAIDEALPQSMVLPLIQRAHTERNSFSHFHRFSHLASPLYLTLRTLLI